MKAKKIAAVVVAMVVIIGGGGYASAERKNIGSHTITPPEGGEWDYGASGGRTWSNFLHDKRHATSVHGHEFHDSGCVKGGQWARAQASQRWMPFARDEQSRRLCED